ncbi:tRNA (guanine(37)-N1)-methyltransferase, partial [Armadillidium vulgare]
MEEYSLVDVIINYENWKANDILEAVLPDNDSGCSGYSIVGHILQLNLREHLLPYKHLIAQVYNDKVSNITMVVNKVDIIDNSDNTFRSFLMEKLAGDSDTTITTVKENNCKFIFDFAKVYWNSRLSTEHERIVKKLNKGDILFDVMAGVGPFSVPTAKKKCQVYANDLNPASYEALKNNCVINKVEDYVECYQMDGKDFIKTVLKEKFAEHLNNSTLLGSVHITMNLPSIAISFLPYLKNLYTDESTLKFQSDLENVSKLPIVHVYLFSNNETPEFALYLVASKLGYTTSEIDVSGDVREISVEQINNIIDSSFKKYVIEIINVRRVAPAKVMFRVSFHLPKEFFVNISVLCHSSKKLKRDAFTKVMCVPSITTKLVHVTYTMKKMKPFVLSLQNFNYTLKPCKDNNLRQILLNPERIRSENDIRSILGDDFKWIVEYSLTNVTINYENWRPDHIFKAVFADYESSSSYSIVGHIMQLNLNEHLLPYKYLIAQVYSDKVAKISMVVNKVDIIDNSDNNFRSFSMEKLAGDSDTTITTVKENNCKFTFDFAKVYWNSRLSTEHERIINKLNKGDVLFDVMAGVGPFSVPAAKKKCQVYANDLNPASYDALKNNCVINKVEDYVECYQMDGKDFIRTIFKEKFIELFKRDNDIIFERTVHITMNLPSKAITFLPYFKDVYGIESVLKLDYDFENISKLPIIHLYLFSYNETPEFALYLVASKLGYTVNEFDISGHVKHIDANKLSEAVSLNFKKYIIEIVNVRKVSPSKVMFRVSFYLPKEVLIRNANQNLKENKYIKLNVSKRAPFFLHYDDFTFKSCAPEKSSGAGYPKISPINTSKRVRHVVLNPVPSHVGVAYRDAKLPASDFLPSLYQDFRER